MTSRLLCAALALSLTTLAGCGRSGGDDTAEPADLVLKNGGIYTLAEPDWAEALAIRDRDIVAVGDNAMIEPLIGPETRVIDLGGRMALPGFHDAHMHPISGGEMLLGCSLYGLLTQEEILAKIAECVAESDEEWVIGDNWDLGAFPDGNPSKSLLDAIEADRPLYMRGSDGHSDWANSKALELAGITAETPDPPKGVIERDPATGEPTGTLRETARAPVEALLPQSSFEERVAALRAALAETGRYGITSLIDAWTGLDDWRVYRHLEDAGELTARVMTSLTYGVNAKHQDEEWEAVFARRGEFASERLDTASVKLFLDGVLEGETAALVEPYTGMGDYRGVLNFDSDELQAAVTRFDALGLQVHMHAIGDLAVREGLDAFAAARAVNGPNDNGHHISHLQLVHPDDYARFAELGVAANFQALWAYPEPWITEINLPVVGPERVNRMYPIGSIARAGGTIVGGSDWAVSSMNPLEAMEVAMTRKDPTGAIEGVLNADEAVPLELMLAAYTIDAARIMRHETLTGTLEAGKRADIVILDRNIFEIPPAGLSEVLVDLTLLDGEAIYEREPAVAAR